MKFKKYSHQSGSDVIQTCIYSKVEDVLLSIDSPIKYRAAPTIRGLILTALRNDAGWSNEVRINAKHAITLTAKKGQIALCLQTGNMARFYADIIKLQAQYLDNKISSAIYILPAYCAARIMGQNMVNFERLTSELSAAFLKVITVPMIIYGFYAD